MYGTVNVHEFIYSTLMTSVVAVIYNGGLIRIGALIRMGRLLEWGRLLE